MTANSEIVAKGLTFPEGPRWHNKRLWFSDFYSRQVYTLFDKGPLKKQLEVPQRPSGLGWTPEGELLVVSMVDRKLLRWNGNTLSMVADLSSLTSGACNDMVVAADGTAYIGSFGFNVHAGEPFKPSNLVMVRPNGQAEVVAENLHFPNGAVITNDGKTLIVAESYAKRLTAFDIQPNGTLSERRLWADLVDKFPDGICLDQSGAVWAAVINAGVVRVEEGGIITQNIELSQDAYACAITDDGEALLVCTSGHSDPDECRRNKTGRIERITINE